MVEREVSSFKVYVVESMLLQSDVVLMQTLGISYNITKLLPLEGCCVLFYLLLVFCMGISGSN